MRSVDQPTGSADGERVLGSVSRHDLVLATVPGAFLASLIASWAFSLSTHTAVTAGALVAAAAIVDGLFRNPPGTGPAAP